MNIYEMQVNTCFTFLLKRIFHLTNLLKILIIEQNCTFTSVTARFTKPWSREPAQCSGSVKADGPFMAMGISKNNTRQTLEQPGSCEAGSLVNSAVSSWYAHWQGSLLWVPLLCWHTKVTLTIISYAVCWGITMTTVYIDFGACAFILEYF